MTLVVDANVALKWFLEEPLSSNARLLLGRRERLVAPSHILAETGHILLRRMRAGEIGAAQARAALLLLGSVVEFVEPARLGEAAFDFAVRARTSMYDALYVAAAQSLDCPLVTDDRVLIAAAGQVSVAPQIIALSDITT